MKNNVQLRGNGRTLHINKLPKDGGNTLTRFTKMADLIHNKVVLHKTAIPIGNTETQLMKAFALGYIPDALPRSKPLHNIQPETLKQHVKNSKTLTYITNNPNHMANNASAGNRQLQREILAMHAKKRLRESNPNEDTGFLGKDFGSKKSNLAPRRNLHNLQHLSRGEGKITNSNKAAIKRLKRMNKDTTTMSNEDAGKYIFNQVHNESCLLYTSPSPRDQ